ncbi:xanthine dehydrogenase family protein molybdopterin-binding subunit [Autumnicola psychrophila]|uniref:Molybdopterin cofactor-binding domain-containing protein n=1 Tax=Autumnicola psychrophila TaxID=3075592 RepID=A0ABU3DRI9_9FLAO|nr:molybdopterin cofactor-binding domain-containing protein [Zunongwangia sp. F225]MDT0686335.1 molybdopterin cofactor-binding domain-containing protein [Zunongwangia sp. F225]
MKSTRRDFIKQLGFVSIGFSILGTACMSNETGENVAESDDSNRPDDINAWLRVMEDGSILILTGKMELGQGIRIAVAQVAAEELNTSPDLVEVNLAETGVTANEGYTAGSRSIETSAMSIRNAAAAAREKLLSLASEKWGVPQSELTLENGTISGGNEKMSLYEVLEGRQLREEIGQPTEIYGKTRRKYVGQPVPRKDISQMVRGNLDYVQDLTFPGMVHARVIRPSGYTSKLGSLDDASLQNFPGFLKLVRIGSFVGVIAEEEYQAIKFSWEVNDLAQWELGDELPAGVPLKEHLKTLDAEVETEEEKGDWESAIKEAPIQHKAAYYKPYLMHAANGPSCAVAYFENEKLQVWSHTQGVYPLRETLANLLEIPEASIHVKGVPGSGCYGHNGADDVAAEAALLAVEFPGRHVRLQWMRDEEHRWEPYGTAMIMELEAGLNSEGKIQGWKYDFWSDGHSTRPNGEPKTLLPARFLDRDHGVPGVGFKGGAVRNSKPYYAIDALQTTSHIFQGPLRKSALRALGAFGNIFAIECFMDELAHKAGKDPVEFRLDHLDDERAIACLDRIKKMTSEVTPKNREGLGYAFARYKNSASYFAVAVHVQVNEAGIVQVKKMWGVIDSGETINPDGLKNQTEGGMIQAASWALREEVQFDKEHVTSRDWHTYPIFRFEEIPEVEVEVIDRVEEKPLGAGEAAQGPTAAAVINAVFDATGERIRDLPVNPVEKYLR